MKMYRCESCGHLFEEGEEKKEFSYLGDYGSKKIYEHSFSCPVCGGDYEEVVKCTKCGSYNAEAGEKLCDDCKKQSVSKTDAGSYSRLPCSVLLMKMRSAAR